MKCYYCGRFLPDDSEFCQYCGKKTTKQTSNEENIEIVIATGETTKSKEFVLHNSKNAEQEELIKNLKENKKDKKTKIRFCKMCGNQIDTQTKKCSGCGKQYFKGIKLNKFLTTVLILSVVILISVILNIVQFAKINKLSEDKEYYQERTSEQILKISNLNKEITNKDMKIKFFDEHVVFVEDDGTNLYHKYDCYKFKRSGYWAYNLEAAKAKGYRACLICY